MFTLYHDDQEDLASILDQIKNTFLNCGNFDDVLLMEFLSDCLNEKYADNREALYSKIASEIDSMLKEIQNTPHDHEEFTDFILQFQQYIETRCNEVDLIALKNAILPVLETQSELNETMQLLLPDHQEELQGILNSIKQVFSNNKTFENTNFMKFIVESLHKQYPEVDHPIVHIDIAHMLEATLSEIKHEQGNKDNKFSLFLEQFQEYLKTQCEFYANTPFEQEALALSEELSPVFQRQLQHAALLSKLENGIPEDYQDDILAQAIEYNLQSVIEECFGHDEMLRPMVFMKGLESCIHQGNVSVLSEILHHTPIDIAQLQPFIEQAVQNKQEHCAQAIVEHPIYSDQQPKLKSMLSQAQKAFSDIS